MIAPRKLLFPEYGYVANWGRLIRTLALSREPRSFSASDFVWDEELDRYECPNGKLLLRSRRAFKEPRTGITKADTIIYKASKSDCDLCELKSRRCPNTPNRKITRSIFENVRDTVRKINQSPEFEKSLQERKKVEMAFAHMKRNLNLVRLRLRGLSGANDEFVMTALAQNLRRMATIYGQRGNCWWKWSVDSHLQRFAPQNMNKNFAIDEMSPLEIQMPMVPDSGALSFSTVSACSTHSQHAFHYPSYTAARRILAVANISSELKMVLRQQFHTRVVQKMFSLCVRGWLKTIRSIFQLNHQLFHIANWSIIDVPPTGGGTQHEHFYDYYAPT